MAALSSGSASEIDKTSFWWAGLCAICHPGGGPTEFDRDGHKFYDVESDLMGFEFRGETADAQEFDGDYAEVDHMTGLERHPVPWDVTGVAEPDCLLCHRSDLKIVEPGHKNMNWIWRAATLRAKDGLTNRKDGKGEPVPAFAAASTAAQGWFEGFGTVPGMKPPKATHLLIDYSVGVADGSLIERKDGTLRVAPSAVATTPTDFSCWGCHATPDDKKRGRIWFDPDEDVHFAALNNLDDADPGNDIPNVESTACTYCHPNVGTMQSAMEHNFAKGNANLGSVRKDSDYFGFDSCRECHLDGKDPNAPPPVSPIHSEFHLEAMACQFCHIPMKREDASLSIDNATTGGTIDYPTSAFLSTDPQDPDQGTTDWWYPAASRRADSDGVVRLFPEKLLLSTWCGDWTDKTGDGPSADDSINSVFLWKVRDVVKSAGLRAHDDNGDGTPEVNTRAEIFSYLNALVLGLDVNGNPYVTGEPVLVKGGLVWYLDTADPSGVDHFEIHASGILTESSHPFSIDHNVLPLDQGMTLGLYSCNECHGGGNTPVFDRMILLDAFDETRESTPGAGDGAQPIYGKLREVSEVDPF